MPTNPEPFPAPVLYPAEIVEGVVEAPAASNTANTVLQQDALPTPPSSVERSTSLCGNILIVQTPQEELAYWLQRKMSKTTRGSLRLAYRVTRVNNEKPSTWRVQPSTSGPYPHEMVAVKIQDKAACEHSSKTSRDPYVEFSALQAMAREEHPDGVVVSGIVSADTEHIFSVMPYFGEGTFAQYVVERGRLSEGVARHFFQQIIAGLCAMQHAGLCHHDLSLENVLLRGTDGCCIGGLGFAIRVPLDDNNTPTLLVPQQSCGTILLYLAPEILQNAPFDGFAVDLWAAGIMLAVMLFGTGFPFVWASPDDRRFREISLHGNLRDAAKKWESQYHATPSVSDDALDLLQNMLYAAPSDRFTIQEIQQHPWFTAEATPPEESVMAM